MDERKERCDKCRWWAYRDGAGICLKFIESPHSMCLVRSAMTGIPAWIETAYDFGCAGWEAEESK